MDAKRLAMRVASSPKFSGCGGESWEKWLSRFELRFRDVEEADKPTVLIDLLDGTALDVCARLNQKELEDYEKIKNTLKDRFGENVVALQAYAELGQAEQRPGEDIEAFGDRILELVEKAYPTGSSKQKQDSGLKQFICGLSDKDLQEKLIAKDGLVSMEGAVQEAKSYRTKACALEAMRAKREGGLAMAARAQQPSFTQNYGSESDTALSIAQMKMQLDQIQDTIKKLEARTSRAESQARGADGQRRCYQCGDTSHIKRQCPQLRGQNREGRRSAASYPAAGQAREEAFCVACGRRGHWMAQCWRVATPERSARQSGERAANQGNE